MIAELRRSAAARVSARFYDWLAREMAPALVRRRIVGASVLACVLAVIYWAFVASDRYVSEAHVVIQRTDLSGGQTMEFSSLFAGIGDANRSDQVLFRDHLLSTDMLRKLDEKLDLRNHYADTSLDLISRLWRTDVPSEWFYKYYTRRVGVEFDEYSGVVVVRAQAFDPETAHAICTMLVEQGGAFMNGIAQQLAFGQVEFLERQVEDMNDRMMGARSALIDFQNESGLVSPEATTESIAGTVQAFEAKLAELRTQRSALQAYLVPDHPNIVQLNHIIRAVEQQVDEERAKIADTGGERLNAVTERYKRLELEAGFAEDMYRTALVALEKGRVEALRTIKKVTVIQTPTMPEDALQPRRLYNSVVFILTALFLAGVLQMLVAIVRDHRD